METECLNLKLRRPRRVRSIGRSGDWSCQHRLDLVEAINAQVPTAAVFIKWNSMVYLAGAFSHPFEQKYQPGPFRKKEKIRKDGLAPIVKALLARHGMPY